MLGKFVGAQADGERELEMPAGKKLFYRALCKIIINSTNKIWKGCDLTNKVMVTLEMTFVGLKMSVA